MADFWILCRKPLEGTVAENVLKHGTGVLNIDGCRIASPGENPSADRRASARRTGHVTMANKLASESNAEGKMGRRGRPSVFMIERPSEALGRWPANLMLSHLPGCRLIGTKTVASSSSGGMNRDSESGVAYQITHHKKKKTVGYADEEGNETVEDWHCIPDCPIKVLDEQSGQLHSGAYSGKRNKNKFKSVFGKFAGNQHERQHFANSGGASRFFKTFKGDE